jgi:hypothetical protein
MLHHEPLTHQLPQHSIKTLLGDPKDAEQFADGHLRMSADKVHDPVMRSAKTIFFEDCVRFGGEIAVGEEQQLDALPDRLLARRPQLSLPLVRLFIYVSHVDLSGNLRYIPIVSGI